MARRVEIDLKRIQADLDGLAGSIPIKIRRGSGAKLSIIETDNLIRIYINPRKIKTQAELDNVVTECQRYLAW